MRAAQNRGPSRWVVALLAAPLAAAAVTLYPNAPHADADDDFGAPHITNVRLDGGTAYVTFVDNAVGEAGFTATVAERDHPDRTGLFVPLPDGAVPGTQRQTTRTLEGVTPGTALCVSMTAWQRSDLISNGRTSPPSNTVCADPAQGQTNLAMDGVRGKDTQEWNTVATQTPAYSVAFRNTGTSDATGITIDVSTSGVAALGDQTVAPTGWDTMGFTCAPRSPAGAETSAMRCTGGHLANGQDSSAAVIVKFTGPGFGTIHAQISGPTAEPDTSDNGGALSVQVVR
jgi:hypothetical protein